MKFRTRAIHDGNKKDPQTGAVVPPICVATTFVQKSAGEFGEYDYSRSGNPTRKNLETTMASLENGAGALAFATGMAATHCVTMLLKSGDHILAGKDIYGGSYRLFHKILPNAGIEISLVDTNDLEALRSQLRPTTRLLWLESPGNPLMTITDLQRSTDWAKKQELLVAVDNTFATPLLTNPLDLGADIVMHSATKYLGGHSDALGGVLVAREAEMHQRLWYIQNATGAVMNPWECFLISRGLKTLAIRVKEQCISAAKIACFLHAHPQVTQVMYPGLESHPGHEIAARQMHGQFGAMLSFEVHGGLERARSIVNTTQLFQLAVSLGAVESLIEQPSTLSHASYDRADRLAHGIKDELIRISVGLEDVDDLIEDLRQALEK
jgi:cystathionine beta-lyase/cystathionine gamma-synthase